MDTHHYDEGLGGIASSWSWGEIRELPFLLPSIFNFPSKGLSQGWVAIYSSFDGSHQSPKKQRNRWTLPDRVLLVWLSSAHFKETYFTCLPPFLLKISLRFSSRVSCLSPVRPSRLSWDRKRGNEIQAVVTSLGFSPEQPVLNVKSHPNPKWPSQSATWPVQLRTLDVLTISSLVFYFLLFIWVNPSSFRNFSLVIPGIDALGLRRSASYERFILEKLQGEGCKEKPSWTSWLRDHSIQNQY